MHATLRSSSLIALAFALGACGHSENSNSFTHFSVVDDSHLAIHARGAADAIVAVDGNLRIDHKPVALAPAQQALLKDYYAGIVALRRDAIATGAAGIATAGTAISSVVSGLANGDPDSIGAKVDAKAAKVDEAAAQICVDLASIRVQQDAITAQLPVFRPYALIDASEVADCSR